MAKADSRPSLEMESAGHSGLAIMPPVEATAEGGGETEGQSVLEVEPPAGSPDSVVDQDDLLVELARAMHAAAASQRERIDPSLERRRSEQIDAELLREGYRGAKAANPAVKLAAASPHALALKLKPSSLAPRLTSRRSTRGLKPKRRRSKLIEFGKSRLDVSILQNRSSAARDTFP